jgi:hypothetical protein
MQRAGLAAAAIIGVVCAMAGAAVPAKAGDVLAIHSYHPGYGWDAKWQAALEAKLDGHDVDTFYMNTKRLPEHRFPARADAAWRKFRAGDYDVVVLGDDNALKYLGPRLAKQTDVPAVFLGINGNPRTYFDGPMPHQITGVTERPLLTLNVRVIEAVLPEAERGLILFDKGVTGRASKRAMRRAKGRTGEFSFDIVMTRRFATWKRHVRTAEAKGYDVIFAGLFLRQKGADGKVVPGETVIAWTRRHSDLPFFGFWGFAVGKGKAVGGAVIDGRPMGAAAGETVATILATGQIPPIDSLSGGQLVVSKSGFEAYDLSMTGLDEFDVKKVP